MIIYYLTNQETVLLDDEVTKFLVRCGIFKWQELHFSRQFDRSHLCSTSQDETSLGVSHMQKNKVRKQSRKDPVLGVSVRMRELSSVSDPSGDELRHKLNQQIQKMKWNIKRSEEMDFVITVPGPNFPFKNTQIRRWD